MSALDQLRETVESIATSLERACEIVSKILNAIEYNCSLSQEESIEELLEQIQDENEAVLSDLIEQRDTERSFWETTPYKPKWKPFMRDKRLTIKRCRSCCRDKIHKKQQKSSFAMSIPKIGKKRYNIYEIAYCMRSRGYHTIRFFNRKEKENGRKQSQR